MIYDFWFQRSGESDHVTQSAGILYQLQTRCEFGASKLSQQRQLNTPTADRDRIES